MACKSQIDLIRMWFTVKPNDGLSDLFASFVVGEYFWNIVASTACSQSNHLNELVYLMHLTKKLEDQMKAICTQLYQNSVGNWNSE